MNCKNNVKVKLDQSNYTTKVILKGAAVVDTSMLAWKTEQPSLNTKIPSTRELVTKAQYGPDKQGPQNIWGCRKMIPNNNGIVKKTDYNTKIAEVQNKIPSVTGLANTAAINTKPQRLKIKTCQY